MDDEPAGTEQAAQNRWRLTNLRPERLSGVLKNGTPHASATSWRGIMHLFGRRVFEQQDETARSWHTGEARAGRQRLRALAAVHADIGGGSALGICPAGWRRSGGSGQSGVRSAGGAGAVLTRAAGSAHRRSAIFQSRRRGCWATRSTCTGPPPSPRPVLRIRCG